MQVKATFDSIEEMMAFVDLIEGGIQCGTRSVVAQAPGVITAEVQKTETPMDRGQDAGAAPTAAGESALDADRLPFDENTAAARERGTESQKEPGGKEYSLEEVRAKLAELNKSGKRAGVKALLAAFGAVKLTEVPAERYGELMEKAGEL